MDVVTTCRCGAPLLFEAHHDYAGAPERDRRVRCWRGHDTIIRITYPQVSEPLGDDVQRDTETTEDSP